jgi:NRPS condensation-like uncharacterized protein
MSPLNPIDEMFIRLENPVRPITIQLEVRVEGRLDETRLRECIRAAAGRHHLARARLKPVAPDDATYFWVIDEELRLDPVRVVDSATAGPLDELRSEFYSGAIPLVESPPFRVLLVHDPGGDLIMLSVNHTACDGIGALRLMQSIGRAYAGVADPSVELDPTEALRLAVPQQGLGAGDRVRDARLNLQQLGEMRSRAAKMAAKDPSKETGYDVHTSALPVGPLTGSELRRRLGATVNDVLLAAIHRTIDEWNEQQGGRTGRVAIGLPVNARPEDWRNEVIANFFTSETVSTSKGQRETPEACLAAVVKVTNSVKTRTPGSALAAQTRQWGGRVRHRAAFAGLFRALAGFLNGTSTLSNLGRVPSDWVDSGEFAVSELRVSPPVVGGAVSIGAISVNDVLHLSLRSNRAILSADATAAFADLLLVELDRYG